MHQIAVLLLLPITTSGVKGDVLNVMFWNRRRKGRNTSIRLGNLDIRIPATVQ